jgi:hypothetical protein
MLCNQVQRPTSEGFPVGRNADKLQSFGRTTPSADLISCVIRNRIEGSVPSSIDRPEQPLTHQVAVPLQNDVANCQHQRMPGWILCERNSRLIEWTHASFVKQIRSYCLRRERARGGCDRDLPVAFAVIVEHELFPSSTFSWMNRSAQAWNAFMKNERTVRLIAALRPSPSALSRRTGAPGSSSPPPGVSFQNFLQVRPIKRYRCVE